MFTTNRSRSLLHVSYKLKPLLLALVTFLSTLAVPIAETSGQDNDSSSDSGTFTFTVLEMDHDLPAWGLAIVMQTPSGETYLYDTGRSAPSSDGFQAGRDVIAPFLENRGIDTIDGIVVSHAHKDHFGGTPYLLDHFKVKRFIDSGYIGGSDDEEYKEVLKHVKQTGGLEYKTVQAGDTLDWGENLRVEVLSPPKGFLGGESYEIPEHDPVGHHLPNLNSVVLRIQHGENVFLLIGDLNQRGKEFLVQRIEHERLRSRVYQPSHGGTAYMPLAKLIQPEFVLVSCRTNHPTPALRTKDSFEKLGSTVYATPWNGWIQVASNGRDLTIETQRKPED